MEDVELTRISKVELLDEVLVPDQRREAAAGHHVALSVFTLLWGSNFVLAEAALQEMTPISFSVARFVMGGLGMLALFYSQQRIPASAWKRLFLPQLERSEWPRLLLVSIMGATLSPWLGIEGLNLTYAGRAAFWLALAPALSAVIGALLRTEQINKLGRTGLVLAALGTLGLAMDGLSGANSYWLGDFLLFASLLLAITELHLIKPLACRHGAMPVVTARTIIGGLIYILIASPSIAAQPWLALGGWTWVAIILGGTVGVGIGQWVKVRALRVIGPTQIVIYGNLVPLATLLIGWLALGSTSTTLELLAGCFIVAGAYCMQRGGAPVLEQTPALS
jgi:drug/metabolite transporter (DMT)-like permease